MPRAVCNAVALAAALAAWAGAPVAVATTREVGDPPPICTGDLFSDLIGTGDGEVLAAARRPQRLWGLGGPDVLFGSDTRATCLLGGRDADVLQLEAGGGVALGEHGADLLRGGPIDDVLLGGAAADTLAGENGSDVLAGNAGVDGFDGGPGADRVDARDGRAEYVDCGPGDDRVRADAVDVFVGCERADRRGPGLPALAPSPRAATLSDVVRVRFRVPEAAGPGAYRVVLVTGARDPGCAGGPRELTRLPEPGRRVARGQRIRVGLRPPPGGWCAGATKAVVMLHRRCGARRGCVAPPPGEPIARLAFQAGGASN